MRSQTKHWKWFVVTVLMTLCMAFIYLRYATEEYEIETKIRILEDKAASSELSAFQDLSLFSGSANNVEDELQMINSRSNLIEVVKELGLNVELIELGNIKNTEVYINRPFKLNFIAPDSIVFSASFEFFLRLSGDSKFTYTEAEDLPEKLYSFGQNIATPFGDIVITPSNEEYKSFNDKRYQIKIRSVARVAELLHEEIIISPADQLSNIATITMNSAIPIKGQNILDALVRNYNKNGVDDKKLIADKTSDFINNRITTISTSLSTVDESAQEFKTDRGITDIASEANINLNIGASTKQELENAAVQLDIASSMKEYVDNQEGYEVLPSNIGLADPSITTTTARYNELVAERNRLLKSSNEQNPIIVNLDQQLDGLKSSMQSSLNSMTNNLGLTVNSLSSQQSRINSRIYSVPKNERALRDITRQQQTTEALYLYLLQKREESQITYASATPNSKVVDYAYSSELPVSPKVPLVYFGAFVLGLLIPFSVIYVNSLLDNKIHNKSGLELMVRDLPVLAELPRLGKKDDHAVHKEDRSVLGESMRILRTNLDYLIKAKSGKNNLIFVTSSVPGEGKTFVASNLALIFSNTNKKVLLIGADIRNPKFYAFFTNKDVDKIGKKHGKRDMGLTEYLYDDKLGVQDIINPLLVHTNTIDVIYSGKIPPNPTELLMSDRMKVLLEEVSAQYDYVVVDTAPLMVVTDTLLISPYANHIIYVVRAGVTENKVVDFPMKLKEEGKLNGLSFVVNGVKTSNLGYGGSYGYGYGKSTKKWWKF